MKRRWLLTLCNVHALVATSPADALQCGNARYLPADTTWRIGTGPAYGEA